MPLIRPALFASTADASALRDRAQPLPYDRDSLAPGEVLPMRDVPFLHALLTALSIHFDGRDTALGDALLALSHLEALRDAATLLGLRLPVTASPIIARFLRVPATTHRPDGAMSISLARKGPLMPRGDLPAFRTATHVYADLPARRYLDVERRIGLRLPRNRRFLPLLSGRPAPDRGRPLICYIATSSWPDKKDYGVGRFARVARQIDAVTGRAFDHLLIQDLDDSREAPPPFLALPPFERNDVEALLGLFAQATLVIGNDTGLTHAAAMTKSPTRRGVIGIYGRYSYLQFTTGDGRHYAIATPFAQAMACSDGSPASDRNDGRYPFAAAVRRLEPEFIAECARRVLEGDF